MSWDGSLFDLEAGDGKLWLTEAVGGLVVTVTPEGEIALAADLSEGHMVPTGLALDGEGNAYVGHETVIPYPDGLANVVRVAADGAIEASWTDLVDSGYGPVVEEDRTVTLASRTFGTADTTVPASASAGFHARLQAAGARSTYKPYAGAEHVDILLAALTLSRAPLVSDLLGFASSCAAQQ